MGLKIDESAVIDHVCKLSLIVKVMQHVYDN